jgi:hypothetical protein
MIHLEEKESHQEICQDSQEKDNNSTIDNGLAGVAVHFPCAWSFIAIDLSQ